MSRYYFDFENGSNSNNGLSKDSAFKDFGVIDSLEFVAGDKILLKNGSRFTTPLLIKNSGSEEEPIVITSYGTAPGKPFIDVEESVYAIRITGEYVILDGIEVSNVSGKIGISVLSELHGATHNIIVKNCYVHDIWQKNSMPPREQGGAGWDHGAGGISVETNREAPTWFEGLRIENNIVENVNRTGIWVGGKWFNRWKNSFPWAANDGKDNVWYPHHDVYVAGNYVDHAAGDGMVVIGCKNLIVEKNRVFYANCGSRKGACSAGLWTMNCDGALVQFNEVAFTGREFGGDGEAYDIDNCSENTIFQYNYSHHNEGGFMLICNITCNLAESHHNNIVRNNLSVNDASKRDCAIFNITGSMQNVDILNNTVYTDLESRYRLFEIVDYGKTGAADNVLFANNLFVSKYKNNLNHFLYNGKFVFDSNIFYNMPAPPKKDNIIDNNIYDLHPVIRGEGECKYNSFEIGGFIPEWNSPLLKLGKHFPNCSDRDYCGTITTGHNYIGAFYYKDANIG